MEYSKDEMNHLTDHLKSKPILILGRVLHKHLPDCLGQVKVRFRQAFWKTKE